MYDYSEADLDELGWDRFVSGLWESIFAGYRGFTGIRTIGRRWSDLLQGGLGCSQELADELVRTEIIMMEGRTALASKDPMIALAAMDKVLADMGVDLAELPVIPQNERSRLLVQLGLAAHVLGADWPSPGRRLTRVSLLLWREQLPTHLHAAGATSFIALPCPASPGRHQLQDPFCTAIMLLRWWRPAFGKIRGAGLPRRVGFSRSWVI